MQKKKYYIVRYFSKFIYKKELNISADHTIEAMVAVGKPGLLSILSEALQKKEEPSDRKKIEEFVFEGEFNLLPHQENP